MRTLVLGTFPPYVRRYQFYYPNKANRFWNILAALAKEDPRKLESGNPLIFRKKLMRKLKTGVHNIAYKITRDGQSSLDKDIEILEYHDLKKIIYDNKLLSKILITGYSGKTSALRGLLIYLRESNIVDLKSQECIRKQKFHFYIYERKITCYLSNSPSPASQRSGVTFKKLLTQFKKAII